MLCHFPFSYCMNNDEQLQMVSCNANPQTSLKLHRTMYTVCFRRPNLLLGTYVLVLVSSRSTHYITSSSAANSRNFFLAISTICHVKITLYKIFTHFHRAKASASSSSNLSSFLLAISFKLFITLVCAGNLHQFTFTAFTITELLGALNNLCVIRFATQVHSPLGI